MPIQQLQALGQSTQTANGQRASALRFGDRRTMALLGALACQSFIPTPIGNRTLRPLVAQLLGETPDAYSTAQMTYDLRRLRLKGLIERLDHSHCYRLTALGLKVATFFTRLYERVFRPGLAALPAEQPWPSDLAQALSTVVEIIQDRLNEAFMVPVTAAA